jgi:hypothetical protein
MNTKESILFLILPASLGDINQLIQTTVTSERL